MLRRRDITRFRSLGAGLLVAGSLTLASTPASATSNAAPNAASNAAASTSITAASAGVASSSRFVPMATARLVAGSTVTTTPQVITVAGKLGIPSNATAVVVNVEVEKPTATGYVRVTPYQQDATVAVQEFAKGQTISNLAVVSLNQGKIQAKVNTGSATLYVDVSGYYAPTGGSAFVPVATARLINAATVSSSPLAITVAGKLGIPSNATAVVANVEVEKPTATGYVRVTPYQQDATVAVQEFARAQTISNLAVVALNQGKIQAKVNTGTATMFVDIAGYFVPSGGSVFVPMRTSRLVNAGDLWASPTSIDVAGQLGIPADATAVVANVEVSQPSSAGYVRVTPSDQDAPVAVQEFSAGQTISNLAIVALNHGAIQAKVNTGSATLYLDVSGYYIPSGRLASLGTVATPSPDEYQGWNWASPDHMYLYATTGGNVAVVKHNDGESALSVQTLDPATLQPVGTTRTIDFSGWPDWGAFYAAPDGYFYVLVGKDNPNEDDTLDVVAVRRYNASWGLVGTAYLKGGTSQGVKGIYAPFDAGHPHMVLVGNRLVVHMSRLIYAISGVHHQVNLTFEVAVDTMAATAFEDLGGYAYSSHSFQQLVAMNGTSLITIDHGDAYPRSIQLGVMANYPTARDVTTYDVFPFNGAEGDNFTGAAVTGLISGPQGVVVLGNSIRQPNAPNGTLGSSSEKRNLLAVAANPATGVSTVRWLTGFSPTGSDTALEPRVVQVGTDRYAVLFCVRSANSFRLEYRLLDSAANIIAQATFPGTFYTTIGEPFLLGTRIYWAGVRPDANDPAPVYLYGLDVNDPTKPNLATG